MPKCDLAIEFDRSDRIYRPGETVSGRVTVQVNAKCQCDALTITRLWHTHGRGNRAEGDHKSEEVVFSGEWWPGETHSYPFQFEVPAGPASYHGEVLNVDHYVAARADIPWALDPKCEEDYLLLPGPETLEFPVDDGKLAAATQTVETMGMACGLLFGLIFAGVGCIPMIIGAINFADGETGALIMVPFGGIFVLAGLAIMFAAVRKHLAERKLGEVEVTVTPTTVSPGDTVQVELSFAPKARIELNQITATLKGEEVVISGSGTNKSTHRHELHEEIQQLLEARDVFPEEGTRAQGTFQVPRDAGPSFAARDNRLDWKVELHIDIARWPDWMSSRHVIVLPVVAS